MKKEFLNPKLEGLDVVQRGARFTHLVPYSGNLITCEEDKMKYYLDWLPSNLSTKMVRHQCSTLEELMDETYKVWLVMEEDRRERKELFQKRKSGNQAKSSGQFKRPAPPAPSERSQK